MNISSWIKELDDKNSLLNVSKSFEKYSLTIPLNCKVNIFNSKLNVVNTLKSVIHEFVDEYSFENDTELFVFGKKIFIDNLPQLEQINKKNNVTYHLILNDKYFTSKDNVDELKEYYELSNRNLIFLLDVNIISKVELKHGLFNKIILYTPLIVRDILLSPYISDIDKSYFALNGTHQPLRAFNLIQNSCLNNTREYFLESMKILVFYLNDTTISPNVELTQTLRLNDDISNNDCEYVNLFKIIFLQKDIKTKHINHYVICLNHANNINLKKTVLVLCIFFYLENHENKFTMLVSFILDQNFENDSIVDLALKYYILKILLNKESLFNFNMEFIYEYLWDMSFFVESLEPNEHAGVNEINCLLFYVNHMLFTITVKLKKNQLYESNISTVMSSLKDQVLPYQALFLILELGDLLVELKKHDNAFECYEYLLELELTSIKKDSFKLSIIYYKLAINRKLNELEGKNVNEKSCSLIYKSIQLFEEHMNYDDKNKYIMLNELYYQAGYIAQQICNDVVRALCYYNKCLEHYNRFITDYEVVFENCGNVFYNMGIIYAEKQDLFYQFYCFQQAYIICCKNQVVKNYLFNSVLHYILNIIDSLKSPTSFLDKCHYLNEHVFKCKDCDFISMFIDIYGDYILMQIQNKIYSRIEEYLSFVEEYAAWIPDSNSRIILAEINQIKKTLDLELTEEKNLKKIKI